MTLMTPSRPVQIALLLMAVALASVRVETGGAKPAMAGRCGPVAADAESTAGMVMPLVDGPYEEDEEEVEIMEARGAEGPGQAAA